MHRDNMEVDSDSDSDTDTSFELDGRMINTIGIGMLDLPSQLAVTPGMTYDTLSALINHLASKKSLVALVQIFGPYPFLRYPKQNEEISPSVRRVYFVEKTENTSIVVVRTHDEDVVVPIRGFVSKAATRFLMPV
ncbi:hypothetical protein FRC18_010222 [Serendipita sp. 400]|nr:hypothetical protein FRC18_010222 [Serendipita sp. 400]